MEIDFTLDSDDRAVSPVIGVILMVAITVILAAVIGTFVLGLGDQVSNTTPQATISAEGVSDGYITLSHGGGDTLESGSTDIVVEGNGASGTYNATSGGSLSTAQDLVIYEENITASGEFSIGWGSTNVTSYDGGLVEGDITTSSDYTVTLVDTASGQIIAEKEV